MNNFGLHECRINGKAAKAENVVVGGQIDVPSGMGGLFGCQVKSIENGVANVVKPPHLDWPRMEFKVHVEPVTLTNAELTQLAEVMKGVNRFGPLRAEQTPDNLKLLNKARTAGLVFTYNEWGWTEKGVDLVSEIVSK